MKTIDITTYRINRLLKERGWSQADLAQKLNLTQPTIQKWVKAKSSPSMENIDKLVELTGHPSHWFMLPPDEDQITVPSTMTRKQEILLELVDELPEVEFDDLLKTLEEKKQKYDALYEELTEKRKRKRRAS